jgi:hypothetical protein
MRRYGRYQAFVLILSQKTTALKVRLERANFNGYES